MMMSRQKIFTIIMAALALIGLVILASGISTLDLNNGPLYLLPASEQAIRETLPARAVQIPTTYLSLLALVFLVLFPISIIYLLISPSARRRFLTQLIQVSLIVLFLFFLSKNFGKLFPKLGNLLSGNLKDDLAANGFDVRFLEPFKPRNPAWLTVLLSVALAAGFVIFLVWLWPRLRQVEDRHLSPAEKVARSAQTALRRIDAGQNLRDVVLRCYLEMTQAVAEKRHLTRPEHVTPHEFVYSLEGIGLPTEQVRGLTALFESVRYGHKIPGAQERAEAVACLNAIVERLGGES
jgi:hypothetical protein